MDRRLVRTAIPVLLAVLLGACDATTNPTPTASVPTASDVTPAGPTSSVTTSVRPTPTPAGPSPTRPPSASPPAPSSAPALVGPAPCPGRQANAAKGPSDSESSTNWSGYTALATKPIFTCVEATWIQPTIKCSGNATRSVSIWVGIGGFDQSGLVQIGSEVDCRRGKAVSSMWRESLPAQRSEVAIDLVVKPGDKVRARVTAEGKSVYELSIVNVTRNKAFTVRETNRRVKTTSAEWIVEAPTGGCPSDCHVLPLPDFGKLRMSGTWLTASGVRRTLIGSGYTHVNDRMVSDQGDTIRAVVTSTAADGSSFVVTWRHP